MPANYPEFHFTHCFDNSILILVIEYWMRHLTSLAKGTCNRDNKVVTLQWHILEEVCSRCKPFHSSPFYLSQQRNLNSEWKLVKYSLEKMVIICNRCLHSGFHLLVFSSKHTGHFSRLSNSITKWQTKGLQCCKNKCSKVSSSFVVHTLPIRAVSIWVWNLLARAIYRASDSRQTSWLRGQKWRWQADCLWCAVRLSQRVWLSPVSLRTFHTSLQS